MRASTYRARRERECRDASVAAMPIVYAPLGAAPRWRERSSAAEMLHMRR